VVVRNGTSFGDGVCARIKEELLKEFDLRTIARSNSPYGTFGVPALAGHGTKTG
jgi:type I restriction enzyme M protein